MSSDNLLPDIEEILHMSSFGMYDETVAEVHSLIERMKLNPVKKIVLYQRQSDPSKQHIHYWQAQENLLQMLLDTGIAQDRIIVLAEDDGKSAWLNEQYRDDYARLLRLIENDECCLVVVMEISRLHRDDTEVQAATMSTRMGWKNVHVLTQNNGEWMHLDMKKAENQDTYKAIAKRAATERKKIRDRSMTSRLQSKREGGASGGGTCCIGWRRVPGMRKHASPDGKKHDPHELIYRPHALIKLRVMNESLLSHIKTLSQLSAHLSAHGIIIPPFDEDVRDTAFSASALCRIYRKGRGQSRVYLRKDEPYTRFNSAFLLNFLVEPLVIGDVRHGSGTSGKYALRKMKNIADQMKQSCDSRILPGRILVRNDRALALCKSDANPDFPPYEELKSLWEQVVRKWSPVDLVTARDLSYRSEPGNDERVNKINRALPNPVHGSHGWSGFVFCGRHEDKAIHFPFRMGTHAHKEQWQCCETGCSTWSSQDLKNILDAHLKRRLHLLATKDEPLFRNIFEQHEHAKREHEHLQKELNNAEGILKKLTDKYDRFDAAFDDDTPESEKDIVLNPIMNAIKKATAEVARKRQDARKAAIEPIDRNYEKTEDDLRQALITAYKNYDTLDVPRKRHVIALLVKAVTIYVADGVESNESLIAFTWANDQTEWLVGWREAQDNRPWTDSETAALKALWPSACDFPELKAALLPGRRYHRIREYALIACKGMRAKKRPTGWKQRVLESEKTWHFRNPNVLYLKLVGFGDIEADEFGETVGSAENYKPLHCQMFRKDQPPNYWPRTILTTPSEVFDGVTLTFSRSSSQEGDF